MSGWLNQILSNLSVLSSSTSNCLIKTSVGTYEHIDANAFINAPRDASYFHVEPTVTSTSSQSPRPQST